MKQSSLLGFKLVVGSKVTKATSAPALAAKIGVPGGGKGSPKMPEQKNAPKISDGGPV